MLELEHQFRVVDVNVRLTPAEQPGGRGPSISPDRLEREMHQAGIVRAIVTPNPRPQSNYVAANNGVARHSVDRPFVAFARINGAKSLGSSSTSRLRNAISRRKEWHTSPADVEQYAYDDRFHGFSLDPAVDGVPDGAVLSRLEDVDLPVLISGGVGAPPAALADALLDRSFPVVVAHFGGHPSNRELMKTMIELLGRWDDCYLDTSLVRYRDLLERALLEHPDRVVFGSGVPACHPNVAIMEILSLDVSEDKLWRAFSKNACRAVPALGPNAV